ncbi:MAG: segregation/condensation protein A [Planctomycetota bacterium]
MTDEARKFIIQQDIFRGPIDLLFFLIQEKELDISEVSFARVTEQYLQFVEIVKELDLDNVGEFLHIAATLLEIKARALFPEVEPGTEEGEEEDFDATAELIGQLLEYKRYKLAGRLLADKRVAQANRFRRGFAEQLAFDRDAEGNPLSEVDLGSLLTVFNELMAQTMRNLPGRIIYDDITVEEHIATIIKRLEKLGPGGTVTFREFIVGRSDRTPSREFMCGAFIAGLELARRHMIRLAQPQARGDILIELVSEEERLRLAEEKNVLYADSGADAAVPTEEGEAAGSPPADQAAPEDTKGPSDAAPGGTPA